MALLPILQLDREGGYERLFQVAPTPMWVYDRDSLRFLVVNRAAVADYGYTEADYRSMTILDLCAPEDVGDLMADLAQRDGPDSPSVRRHRRADGSMVNVEV